MEEDFSDYKIAKKIGEGGYGKIYEVLYKNGTKKALKQVNASELSIVEMDILRNIDNQHLVKAYDVSKNGFILDLMEGDVSKLKLNPKEILSCFCQILDAIYCMHRLGILHMDIKPENFLYKFHEDKLVVMLSDFGISSRVVDAFKPCLINVNGYTEDYRPPEYDHSIKGKFRVDSRCDIWALCVSIVEMMGVPKIKISYKSSLEKKKEYFSRVISNYNGLKFSKHTKLSHYDIKNFSEILSDMYSPFEERINSRELINLPYVMEICKGYLSSPEKKNSPDKKNSSPSSGGGFSTCNQKDSINYLVPFVNHFTVKGIRNIYNKCLKKDARLFFLAVEIFLQIESMDHMLYDEEEERELSSISIKFAKTQLYGDELKGLHKNLIFYISEQLSSRIRGERFYEKAKCWEDLAILKDYLLTSTMFLQCYNLLDPRKVFDKFRDMYDYDVSSRGTDTSKNMKMSVKHSPGKKTLGGRYKEKGETTRHHERKWFKEGSELKLDQLEDYKVAHIDPQTILRDGYHLNINEEVDYFRNKDYAKEVEEMNELCFLFKNDLTSSSSNGGIVLKKEGAFNEVHPHLQRRGQTNTLISEDIYKDQTEILEYNSERIRKAMGELIGMDLSFEEETEKNYNPRFISMEKLVLKDMDTKEKYSFISMKEYLSSSSYENISSSSSKTQRDFEEEGDNIYTFEDNVFFRIVILMYLFDKNEMRFNESMIEPSPYLLYVMRKWVHWKLDSWD